MSFFFFFSIKAIHKGDATGLGVREEAFHARAVAQGEESKPGG